MRILKDMLTAMALVALCGLSLSAGYRVLRCELPERGPYDLRELWDVLATEEVAALDEQTQSHLVSRLDAELTAGMSLREKYRRAARDEVRSQRLERNLEALARRWLFDQADDYAALEASAGDNPALVDRFLVEQFAKARNWMSLVGGGGDFYRLLASVDVLGRKEAWLEGATPERREKVDRFLSAMASRLMLR